MNRAASLRLDDGRGRDTDLRHVARPLSSVRRLADVSGPVSTVYLIARTEQCTRMLRQRWPAGRRQMRYRRPGPGAGPASAAAGSSGAVSSSSESSTSCRDRESWKRGWAPCGLAGSSSESESRWRPSGEAPVGEPCRPRFRGIGKTQAQPARIQTAKTAVRGTASEGTSQPRYRTPEQSRRRSDSSER
jgi:hypothetical protein